MQKSSRSDVAANFDIIVRLFCSAIIVCLTSNSVLSKITGHFWQRNRKSATLVSTHEIIFQSHCNVFTRKLHFHFILINKKVKIGLLVKHYIITSPSPSIAILFFIFVYT